MSSLATRLALRYVRKKAEEDPSQGRILQQDSSESAEVLQSVQAADHATSSGRRGSFVSDDPKSLIARVLEAYRVSQKPGAADVEINGEETHPDWDAPEAPMYQDAEEDTDEDTNENINREAVRKAIACLMNNPTDLPEIGRKVERIVRQMGTADIYFDDGTWVSATVEDPQPQTGGCSCGGSCGGNCGGSCGSKSAKLETVDMISATRDDEFMGAVDSNKAGARSPYYWKSKVGSPFDLWLLRRVPIDFAIQLADFGMPSSRLRRGRDVWRKLKRYASPRPFKSVQK